MHILKTSRTIAWRQKRILCIVLAMANPTNVHTTLRGLTATGSIPVYPYHKINNTVLLFIVGSSYRAAETMVQSIEHISGFSFIDWFIERGISTVEWHTTNEIFFREQKKLFPNKIG